VAGVFFANYSYRANAKPFGTVICLDRRRAGLFSLAIDFGKPISPCNARGNSLGRVAKNETGVDRRKIKIIMYAQRPFDFGRGLPWSVAPA